MNQSDSNDVQNRRGLSKLELHRLELDQARLERDARTAVYFIQAQVTGLIKIGVAMKPNDRLAALQIGSPDKLHLLGVIRQVNAAQLERELHAAMERHWSHGEWFRPVPELLAYIAEHTR